MISILFERGDELVEAIETTAFDFGDRISDSALCSFLTLLRVEDLGQFLG
jgi:hypothetical protein